MKKIYHVMFAASLLLAASCAKEQQPVVNGNEEKMVEKTFTADLTDVTKTSLVDGKKVYWTEGDKISVFDNVNNKNNAFASANLDGTLADFTGYTADGATEYVAVYPYQFGASYDAANRKITTNIPCMQKAVNGSFDSNLNIAVAVSDGAHLSFKNVMALVKVTIPDDVSNVRSLSFVTGTYISGKVEVRLAADGTFTVAGNSSQNNSFKEVNLDNGGVAMTSGDYYFVVTPGTYNKIYLSVTTIDDQMYTKYSNSTLDVKSNDVIDLGNVPTAGSKNFKITNMATAPISLEDNWTIGWEIDESYAGKKLTWSNRNTNIISTAPGTLEKAGTTGTAEIVFNKRPGIAILNATYDGVTYPITFDVRPWYRDDLSDWALATTDATMSEVKESDKGESYVEVTSNAGGHANIKRLSKPWISPSMAPIACIRITDVADDGYSSSIKFDMANFKFNNVSFAGEVGGGNRTFAHKYKLSDGSVVLAYDFSSQKIKKTEVPSDFLADGNIQFKICDFKKDNAAAQATYKFFWFRTFGSIADLESYLSDWSDDTGLTYEKVK